METGFYFSPPNKGYNFETEITQPYSMPLVLSRPLKKASLRENAKKRTDKPPAPMLLYMYVDPIIMAGFPVITPAIAPDFRFLLARCRPPSMPVL